MSTEQNIQTVKDFLAAIGHGDKKALLALVAEDIEWIIPGEDWPLAGTHRGHAGLAALLETASKSIETSTEPREFVAQGDRVLVVGFAKGKVVVGPESKPPPWFKAIHSDRILALLKQVDFRSAVDLLVYDYQREHASIRTLRQREVTDRLAAINRIRFVTGIDRRYSVGGKTVAITTEAAAANGDIALKPTRTKFEFEQNLTYALAELLGAAQISDTRRLSVALLPLLMCETSADLAAYLERQGITPPTWADTAMPLTEPEMELEPSPSPQQTVIHALLTEMFDQATAAGLDEPRPPPTLPPTTPPAPLAPRPQFTLPDLEAISLRIESPSDQAVAAKPRSEGSGGWYAGGSSSWRPPDAYDVDRDQKVGARGEEIVYLAELERVRALG